MATTSPAIDPATASDLLATMWRIRCFEEQVERLTRKMLVHGLVHLSIGGEGVATGVCSQLRDDDAVYTGHRGHGHALAKGAPLDRMLAELMGRDDGLCRGLGGSMHLVDVAHGLLGATGVVAGNIPLAVGSALAARVHGGDAVVVTFFGDGAVQAGAFAESVNLASLWELPIVFVCENNGFAEFTSRAEHTKVDRVVDLVAPYGFPTAVVEGSDVLAVRESFGVFLEQARGGGGPFLLECLTHRRSGHYVQDAQAYRDPVAETAWASKDPVALFATRAVAEGWIDEDAAGKLETDARSEVEAGSAWARERAFPDIAVAESKVYA
jgi:TPP-dependent pyruvate/acetoin dehydrogenase alpha subunit